MSGRRALIVAGGDQPSAAAFGLAADADLVIAADSGADHLLAASLRPHVVVGDLDSISPAARLELVEQQPELVERPTRNRGEAVEVIRHRVDKDKTDLELALDLAVERGCDRVVVLGIAGGRPDHELANIMILSRADYRSLAVNAVMGTTLLSVAHDTITVIGETGSTVSLFAVGGTARGVRTTGLRYRLVDEDLEARSSRGVSNEMTQTEASISLTQGVVLVMQPGALAST